jgi:predicted nucleotidyltransferase
MDIHIQNELDTITKSILQTVSAETIYLFGSYAYGTPSEESDLDIYVVVPDHISDISELYGDIRMSLWKKKTIPLDLLIGTSSIFNQRKDGPTLERTIAEKGTILYGT